MVNLYFAKFLLVSHMRGKCSLMFYTTCASRRHFDFRSYTA